jgi:hypothetical protein
VITGSIVLALVAAALLVLGVVTGPELFYYGSIGASVLAGLALISGLRHQSAAQARAAELDPDPVEVPAPRASRRVRARSGARASIPVTDEGTGRAPADIGLPDEPPEQPLTPVAAARLSRLATEVVVIDGRPRFHLDGCLHLLGRATQRLPVLEAMAGGFTPCALCQPAGTLTEAEPPI